jgi:putative tryptophan/tyrosine transport system substrate-binding protein
MTRGTSGLLVALALTILVVLCGGAAPPTVARVGMLTAGSGLPAMREVFHQSLRDLGYVEGHNLTLEQRQAGGELERLPALAAALVQGEPHVIVALGPSALRAAQQATRTIPIVMLVSGDPIGAGFVPNLTRPGGNITGMTTLSSRLSARRLAVLKEGVPQLTQVAVLLNPAEDTKVVDWQQTQVAARAWGVRVHPVELRRPGDLAPAFAAMRRERPDALLVLSDGLTFRHRAEIIRWATDSRVPAMYEIREYVEAGGLMAYGPRRPELFQRLAAYVDQILKGAKPGELPIEAPTAFELVINLKTAQALGLTLPPSLLSQATEVIR